MPSQLSQAARLTKPRLSGAWQGYPAALAWQLPCRLEPQQPKSLPRASRQLARAVPPRAPFIHASSRVLTGLGCKGPSRNWRLLETMLLTELHL